MYLQAIHLRNYRNLSNETVRVSQGVNVFVGDNGQGKTNLLEAVYYICHGSTFRAGGNSTLVGPESIPALIQARVESKGLLFEVNITLENKSRTIRINQKNSSSTGLMQKFPVVLFSPESLSAIKEGPEQRRRLLDEFLVSHHLPNATLLADFQRCLKSRNRVLRDYKRGLIDRQEANAILDSLDGTYWKLASRLTTARIEALRSIAPLLKETMNRVSATENVDIAVDYEISEEHAISWDDNQVRDAIFQRLLEMRPREMDAGGTLVGPQKHDVRFLYSGMDSRYYCSQGQQRALILSFKMAQIMYHYRAHQQYPILLLDDVMSELDQEKRTNLVDFLQGINSQILLTTTDLNFSGAFDRPSSLSVFHVRAGKIKLQGD